MRYVIMILFLVIKIFGFSQDEDNYTLSDTLSGRLNIFNDDALLSFTLKSDFKKFRKEKYKDKYQDAVLIYQLSDSVKINRNVKIKARGVYRKQNCFFPPIRLNLKKNDTLNSQITGYYKVKMVTHCKGSKIYQQYILKEYLCYKLYNVLTPISFKVKLLDVNYFDTSKKKDNVQKMFAFFIEDIDMLVERNNAFIINAKTLNQNYLVDSVMMKMALFQFMIGNTDWSLSGLHNIKLIKSKIPGSEKVLAIPYDFDYSGMVNTIYAIPDKERIGTESVRERFFLGLCKSEADYNKMINEFLIHKNEFYHQINDFEYLEVKQKKEMIAYLDEFYQMIEYKRFYSDYIKSTCRDH